MVSEWDLPELPTHVSLDCDELLVIDWFLAAHYLANVSRGAEIGEVIQSWHGFRMDVWQGIRMSEAIGQTYRLAIDEGTAKYLFNWLPPTFLWGTGRDCGFSLKVKLHRFLGGEPEEVVSDHEDATESSPKDTSGPDA